MDYFPFETYIHSCDEEEHEKDVKKKNQMIKYINLLTVDPLDLTSLRRLAALLVFFRSTFSKDECIRFFLETCTKQEKELLGYIIFDVMVRSKQGEIGELDKYCIVSSELQEFVDYSHPINANWDEIKKEMTDIV